jgi:formiminotetrahydrofolate cyclodeaminase
LELKALTRQSRDLIALAIKCFSAHTYYVNSRIISEVNVASGGGASGSLFGEAGVTVSELLLEMDFVKRELYSVINLNKSLENDKHKLKGHLKKMEDEMQMTIQSYMQIIEAQQTEETKETDKLT